MKITDIQVRNYRNYASAEVRLGGGVNLFVGDNAQGKTNLLESVRLASVGRSARTPRWQELIKWGEQEALVRVRVVRQVGGDEISVRLGKAKAFFVNGLPLSRMGELMGVLRTVLFSPDELRIVKDGPGERRRFMDIAVCQLSRAYFYTLTRYNKALAQRNRLLKNAPTDDAVEVWDMQLAREGARVIKTRRGFVARLAELARGIHRDLSGGEELELSYEGVEGEDVEDIGRIFLAELKKSRSRDRAFGLTHVGPQRDDLAIVADGADIRAFGSQGQQRTAALSLKLAETELFGETSGEYPVLLLDDVLSELDEKRQAKLLERIKAYQTIVTCTGLTTQVREQLGEVTEFRVTGGEIAPVR